MFDIIRPSRVSFTHMETVQLPVKDCLIKTLKNAVKVLKRVTHNVKSGIWFKVISEDRWHFHLVSIILVYHDQCSRILTSNIWGKIRPWVCSDPDLNTRPSAFWLLIREIRLLIFWQIIMVNRYNVRLECTTSA